VQTPQSQIQPKTRERGIAPMLSVALMFFTFGPVGLPLDGSIAHLVNARGPNPGPGIEQANEFATQATRNFFIANFPDL